MPTQREIDPYLVKQWILLNPNLNSPVSSKITKPIPVIDRATLSPPKYIHPVADLGFVFWGGHKF